MVRFHGELEDVLFRDPHGRVVGRVLPSSTVAFDPAAISAELLKEDEPRLCPAPGPDKPGGSEKGRDYEDYVKKFINPENPTPRGWGVFSSQTRKKMEPSFITTTVSTRPA